MPIYFYWGEDDFALQRAVVALRDRTLDPAWASFNYDKIPPDPSDSIAQGLNQAMTPPFGAGNRLIWLVDTPLCQRCSEEVLADLERTLPVLPETTTLLLTSPNKPDGRLKSTKLLQKYAEIREFATIPPWKTDQLVEQVKQAAQEVGVKLTSGATQRLAEAVGNDSRQLFSELEKLRLYQSPPGQTIGEEAIAALVTTSAQGSLQLATLIRQGHLSEAFSLLGELFRRNEHPLGIVKTLVGQFRLWLWIKVMMEAGERDEREVARAAEVSNPKRIYFLKQEVAALSISQLRRSLPLLLELEAGLKQGADEMALFQTTLIELCRIYTPSGHKR